MHHLTTLLNAIDESITTLEDLGQPADKWDDILNYFIVSRIANGTCLDWIKHIQASKLGDLQTPDCLMTRK